MKGNASTATECVATRVFNNEELAVGGGSPDVLLIVV
jgi:hypothetical protein